MCLWCSDKSKVFRSVKATQQHMVDKGHCMVLYDGDAVYEYADFYDYTYVIASAEKGRGRESRATALQTC